jgi:hypothetical protein
VAVRLDNVLVKGDKIMIQWVDQYVNMEFSSGPYMGQDGKSWCAASKRWMTTFLKSLGATNIKFTRGHYEWSMFARIGEQWWYFSSGDVRYKIMKALLVRHCDGPKDYSGKGNQFVNYDQGFEDNLRYKLEGG